MKRILILGAVFAIVFGIFLIKIGEIKAEETGYAPEVKIYNPRNLHLDSDFFAFDQSFKGGVNLAIGDLNGDGKEEIIAASRLGGGPQVRVFNKSGKFTGDSFFAFPQDYRGGISIAAGDVNGDKKDEIIVSQLTKSEPLVKVYRGDGKVLISQFFAFDKNFKGGVNVAAGDINGDKKDEIIVGSGKGGSHVRVFDKSGKFLGFDVFPFGKDFKGGVNVGVGDVDNDNKDEIAVSQASRGQAWVKVYKVNRTKYVFSNFLAYPGDFKGGATVAIGDVDGDGAGEIITGTGGGGGPQVRSFETDGKATKINFFPYDKGYKGGVAVAVGKIDNKVTEKILTAPLGRFNEEAKYPYNKYIEVNISEQKLKYFNNGDKVDEFLVSTGIYGFDTPTGIFNVFSKTPSARMTGFYGPGSPLNYDLPGVPWVMSFLGPYTIHGTYWHNNFGNQMSHGCINLPTPKAYELYQWADIGTTVVVHY